MSMIEGIPIPSSNSGCSEWIAYHKQLIKPSMLGKGNGGIVWLKTWGCFGSSTCTTNSDFNKYFAKYDINVSTALTSSLAGIGDLGSGMLGVGKTLMGVITIGVPVALAITVIPIGIFLFRQAKTASLKYVANVIPAGRAAKMMK